MLLLLALLLPRYRKLIIVNLFPYCQKDNIFILYHRMSIAFYSVKIMSIVIISIIYFFCGTALSVFLDIIISEEDPAKKSTIKLTAEIAGIFGIIGVAYYGMRHFIKYMPFPLDGMYNFKYKLLKEASGGVIISYILFTYQDKLKAMMIELQKRMTTQFVRK
jgi:hypothetical protein